MLNPPHRASLIATEHGGFAAVGSAVGAAVGRSHSAVSLHIRALEDALGAPLVDRGRPPPATRPRLLPDQGEVARP